MSTWFCKVGGRELGPISSQYLKRLAAQGDLQPQDFLRRGSQGPWVQAAKVRGLFPLPTEETVGAVATTQVVGLGSSGHSCVTPPRVAHQPPPPKPPASRAPTPGIHIDTGPDGGRVSGKSGIKRRTRRSDRSLLMVLVLVGVLVMGVGLWFMLDTGESDESGSSADGQAAKQSRISLDELELGYNKDLAKQATEIRPAQPSIRWHNAAKERISLTQAKSQLAVSIKSVVVGRPPKMETRGERLIVTLRLENAGATQPVDYRCWGLFTGTVRDVSLKDDQGKSYRTTAVVSQRPPVQSIAPGEAFEDILLFEPPDPAAKQLRLELPGSAVGASQPLRFAIPIEMVQASLDKASEVAENGAGDAPRALSIDAYTAANAKDSKGPAKPEAAATPPEQDAKAILQKLPAHLVRPEGPEATSSSGAAFK